MMQVQFKGVKHDTQEKLNHIKHKFGAALSEAHNLRNDMEKRQQ